MQAYGPKSKTELFRPQSAVSCRKLGAFINLYKTKVRKLLEFCILA